jgi:hypothetical protein
MKMKFDGVIMRVFKVKETGEFAEYKKQSFKSEHEEQTLEAWLEKNSESIVEDSALLIIGRQIATNLGSYIDLLALDREGNIAILELKRDRTPRDTIAQALEYASWAENLEYENLEQILRGYMGNESLSLTDYHKAYFKLEETEGVSFNKDQRIVIVGHDISPEIRQTALFLRNKGIRTTCLQFSYFQTDLKEQLMSVDIVVGKENLGKGIIRTETKPSTNKRKLLADLNESGRPVFEAILAMAEEHRLPIHWGSVGFSLNADVRGTHVGLIQGYPLSCAYSQIIYTYFPAVRERVKDGGELIESFKDQLAKTGLFEPTGKEMKYVIRQKPTKEQIDYLVKLIKEFADQIQENGLIE